MMRNERSRLRTWFAAVVAILIGIVFLYISHLFPGKWYERVLNDLGSIVIVSVALVLVFDAWQKEAFFAELFKTARASAQLSRSGLSGFSASFHDDIEWDDLFRRSTHLDIFFVYGATWRNTHTQRIEQLLARDRSRLRVVLPDTAETAVMAELALRFALTPSDLVSRIQESMAFFRRLSSRFPGKVEVYAIRRSMTHSFYRFNNDAVVALYNHIPERRPVATFVCERGGGLYEFIRSDFYGVIEGGVKAGYAQRLDFAADAGQPPASVSEAR